MSPYNKFLRFDSPEAVSKWECYYNVVENYRRQLFSRKREPENWIALSLGPLGDFNGLLVKNVCVKIRVFHS